MKIRTIIVDDEPMARGVIRKHTGHFDMFDVLAECQNAIETINVLNAHEVDLIFLDINMPQINGLELLGSLKNPPLIVITTAYSEFGVKSYEYTNIIDYLLKPITFERFLKNVDKIKTEMLKMANFAHAEPSVKKPIIDDIVLKLDKTQISVKAHEVVYLQAYGNYVKVFMENNDMVLVLQTLQEFENQLSDANFIRCHKSYIINKTKIRQILSKEVDLGNTKIPIGITYKRNLGGVEIRN